MSFLSARAVSRTYRRSSLFGSAKPKNVLCDVSMDIGVGETLGLVGRSGCGKSTLSRLLVGLERPDSGEVLFKGRPLRRFKKGDWLDLWRSVQMVFQDAAGAVDPRDTVGEIIAEPLRHLSKLSGDVLQQRVRELLLSVDLSADDACKYPVQMSGGQLQRVCIARALAPRPQMIILDESLSNLDLHLQIKMLDLFGRLRRDFKVAFLFVTHDLRLVERFCSRVLVMENGCIVEDAPIAGPLVLSSAEGKKLQEAILPAMPAAARASPSAVEFAA